MVAVASFLPGVRLWGINHLAFYPVVVRVTALVLVGLCFVPWCARSIHTALRALVALLERVSISNFRTIAIATAVVCASLFFFFRSSTNLLGDGQLIARSFEAAAMGNTDVIMRSAGAIVSEEHIAPGVSLLYYVSAKWATGVFGSSAVNGIRVFNCLLGGLFVFLLLLLVRRARISHDQKLWLLGIGLFGAATQLYFGYVENYTPLVFTLFLYVVSCLLLLHRRIGIFWPIFLFVVSGYLHVQAWVFAPSLFFLVVWRVTKGRHRLVLRIVPPVLILLTIAGVAAGYSVGAKHYLLPIYQADKADSYSILSLAHIVDVANQLLLLMPILPLVLALAWAGRRLWRRVPDAEKKLGKDEWLAQPEEWHLITLMLVPNLLYLTVFDPEIGMARDWDLFGMFSVVLVPYVLLVVGRHMRASRMAPEQIARFSTPALALIIVLGISWFGINASKWRTAERFERILQYDRAHGSYAWENLAIFYYDNGRVERATGIMEHTYGAWRNPRHAVRLAMYYDAAGRHQESAQLMYNVLKHHPDSNRARMKLIMTLELTGRWPDMVPVAREGAKYHPGQSGYLFYLGESLLRTGAVDEALAAFRRCLQVNPDAGAREYIESVFTRYGDPDGDLKQEN
ncbi:MAG: tetratricopeptide repeat protein [Candidatus Krumholzibacteriota bacterium]|nr:tetratricopeptide repeat protein [Candidatus Krumholzibacteriota bacterium]